MNFKEKLQAQKDYLKALIKDDTSADDIERINGLISSIDEVDKEHDDLLTEHAKTKDSLVRLVVNQGSSEKPKDDSGGSNPKSVDEILAELEKEAK